ncbi:flagellar basal-body MS-ring/collar protein FliF, partial [Kaarinaea lacus]
MREDSQQEIDEGIRKYPFPTRYLAGFIILIVGLCFLGVAAVLWSAAPAYTELLRGIDHEESAAIATELQNNNISFRFEPASGAISVPSDELYYARVKLAAKGLLYTNDADRKHRYVVVAPDSTSESDIQGLPHQLLETELAKSIASIDHVRSARVHLALANVAGENNNQPSRASVVVRLSPGHRLTEAKITSISHLIASSVSNLSIENITIIDQSGKLLKSAGTPNLPNLTAEQFNYARRVEQSYLDRIENILIPILGTNAVRSQVTAELEFIYSEPSNLQKGESLSRHFKSGNIRRLSATVVVDNRLVDSGDGQLSRVARSADEMKRIT